MKIAHLCLSNYYVDGFTYQENELVRQHVIDGHDVVVIASTETIDAQGKIGYCAPSTYMGTDGARVIRLPYSRWLPHTLMRKLRIHPNVLSLLGAEKPDVILFHSLCGWELLTVKRYKNKYPKVRVYADSHEDFNNSARTFLSRNLLHRIYYRTILHRALSALDKILCISVETLSFVRDFYGVPENMLEFYPLGGVIYDDDYYQRVRHQTRERLNLSAKHVLFVQSGKMDKSKKVLETLSAFTELKDENARLILAGSLLDEIADQAISIINKDGRIRFIGWQSPDELRALLCAADVYVQPGTQSATMQMSLCARCAVILDDVPSHAPYVDGNGWLISQSVTLQGALKCAMHDKKKLHDMSSQSHAIAHELLDYRVLAARICH
jgi:1,2-diacylglycerol 3-alpha-glucosyltransferase